MSVETHRVYESTSLALDVMAPPKAAELLYITFSSHQPNHSGVADARAFANGLARAGRSALFFVSKANHWFNCEDIQQAVEIALSVRQRFARAVTVGASMGGHAALRLSGRLQADAAVAVSPQYCVSKERAPFERRWRRDSQAIRHWDIPIGRETCGPSAYVVFDSTHATDVRHVEEIRACAAIHEMPLPYSGHSSVNALADVGVLDQLFQLVGQPEDREVVARIHSSFELRKHEAATVVIERAKAMEADARKNYLRNITSVVGMRRSQKAFEKFKTMELAGDEEGC